MKVIAHRGFSETYPENTLLAFRKALECGADGIETDLRLSLDHIPFIFHDSTLRHIADLDRVPEELTLKELQSLDIGRGEKIPSLKELLKLVNAQTTLVLEIKFNPLTYRRLCELIETDIKDKLSWVEISCFDDRVLEYMHMLNPAIKLHKLIDDPALLEDDNLKIRYDYTSYFDISIKLKKSAFERGLLHDQKVIFWTVDREDISREKEAGLYAIMTNNPTLFL